MEKQTYEYTDIDAGYDKYDDAEPDVTGRYVKAVYTKASRAANIGNPLIEALPDPLTNLQLKLLYNKPIPDYDENKITKMIRNKDKAGLLESTMSLRDLKLILPKAERLEDYVHTLLVESYRERCQIIDTKTDVPLHITNASAVTHSQLVADDEVGGPPGGIALLGYAGSGKTNLVRTLMSHYPNMIVHSTKENPVFYQIPILLIECSPYSNMSALWEDFGTALDKRLNNIDNYYHDTIARKRNLTDRINLVINYIKLFNIGLIVIDEIEHLNFANTKKDSFEEILTLQNKTNVGIAVIGNEEAYRKMFTDLRQQRRFNKLIHGSEYCHIHAFTNSLILQIMQHQWFEPKIDFNNCEDSQKYIDVMYKNTKGIVDQIITLWQLVNFDWIAGWTDKGKKHKITPEYIERTAQKYLPEVTKELLNNLDDIAAGTERQRQNRQAEEAMLQALQSAQSEKEQKDVLDYYQGNTEAGLKTITNKAVSVIRVFHKEFTAEMIANAVRKLYPKYQDTISEDEYCIKVMDYLEKQMKKASGKRSRHPNNAPDFSAYMEG